MYTCFFRSSLRSSKSQKRNNIAQQQQRQRSTLVKSDLMQGISPSIQPEFRTICLPTSPVNIDLESSVSVIEEQKKKNATQPLARVLHMSDNEDEDEDDNFEMSVDCSVLLCEDEDEQVDDEEEAMVDVEQSEKSPPQFTATTSTHVQVQASPEVDSFDADRLAITIQVPVVVGGEQSNCSSLVAPESPAFCYRTLIDAGQYGYFARIHEIVAQESCVSGDRSEMDPNLTIPIPIVLDQTTPQDNTTVSDEIIIVAPESDTNDSSSHVNKKDKKDYPLSDKSADTVKIDRTHLEPSRMVTRRQERLHWLKRARDYCIHNLGAVLVSNENEIELGVKLAASSPLQKRRQRKFAEQFSPQKLSIQYRGQKLSDNIIYFLRYLNWNKIKLRHEKLQLHNIQFHLVIIDDDQRFKLKFLYNNADAIVVGTCDEGYLVTKLQQSVHEYLRHISPGALVQSRMQSKLSFARDDFDYDFPVYLIRSSQPKTVEGPIMLLDMCMGMSKQQNDDV